MCFLSHVLKNPKLMEDKIKVHQSEKIMNASKILHSENVIGDAILECSNSLGFNIHNVEHAKFVERVYMCKSMMDCYACSRTENVYEGMSVSIGSYNVLFSTVCHISNEHLLYCDNCSNCQYCFGCIGLKNKQYCILNKQYSKEEYENLVPKIIEYMKQTGERWEFFDPSLSPFGYNETVGNERFPLTREEALARGYKRQDNHFDPIILEWVEVLKWDKIPNDIDSVSDDVLKKIFACEDSGRVFRITKQELEFYRKHNLPLPRKHPNIRHSIRIKKRPLRGLYLRNCDKCKKEMISIFSQDYSWTVYCSSCYSQEFYS